MNVEVVEFYPLTHDETKGVLTGTLRVKILDFGIHILGVYVSKRKDYWHFMLPGKKTIHSQTGEPTRYPFLVFDDQEKQCSLMAAIRKEGRAYIEKRLTDSTKPLVIPEKQPTRNEIQKKVSSHVPDINKIAKMEWRDPPPRKKQPAYGFKNVR